MLLSIILFLNMHALSFADSFVSCEEYLASSQLNYEQVKTSSSFPSDTKLAAEFLLENQNRWTFEEKISHFMKFIETHDLSLFDVDKALVEVPHILLNTEFNIFTRKRMHLAYKRSWTSLSRSPAKIKFRNRPWKSIADIGHDVILWNFMINEYFLNQQNRTLMHPSSFIFEYQSDAQKSLINLTKLMERLLSEKLLQSDGVKIQKNLNDIRISAQKGQESCKIVDKGSCHLLWSWTWQNFMRATVLYGMSFSTVYFIENVHKVSIEDLSETVEITKIMATGEIGEIAKNLKIKIQEPSQDNVCEVVQRRISSHHLKAKELEAKQNKGEEDLKKIAVSKAMEKGLKEVYPECQ